MIQLSALFVKKRRKFRYVLALNAALIVTMSWLFIGVLIFVDIVIGLRTLAICLLLI